MIIRCVLKFWGGKLIGLCSIHSRHHLLWPSFTALEYATVYASPNDKSYGWWLLRDRMMTTMSNAFAQCDRNKHEGLRSLCPHFCSWKSRQSVESFNNLHLLSKTPRHPMTDMDTPRFCSRPRENTACSQWSPVWRSRWYLGYAGRHRSSWRDLVQSLLRLCGSSHWWRAHRRCDVAGISCINSPRNGTDVDGERASVLRWMSRRRRNWSTSAPLLCPVECCTARVWDRACVSSVKRPRTTCGILPHCLPW